MKKNFIKLIIIFMLAVTLCPVSTKFYSFAKDEPSEPPVTQEELLDRYSHFEPDKFDSVDEKTSEPENENNNSALTIIISVSGVALIIIGVTAFFLIKRSKNPVRKIKF